MISIFKDESIYHQPSPDRLSEIRKEHEEKLKSLGIMDDEFQTKEKKTSRQI